MDTLTRFASCSVVVACTLLLSGCGGDAAESAAGTPAPEASSERMAPAPLGEGEGRLVIIGGALSPDNEAVYRAVLDGRDGSGPICVVPTASGEPQRSMATAIERIDRWGGPGTAEGVLITVGPPEEAEDPAVVEQMSRCSGFYFTGGSQSRVVRAFRPDGRSTPAHQALLERWRAGAVVAGSSAGAAMMGGRIITGGASDDAFAVGVGDDPAGVEVSEGLGLFEGGWVDQHFLARGRWGRLLMTALRADPYDVGYGIDENTALVVDGTRGVVVGASGVIVIDAREAEGSAVIEGVTLSLAGAGDAIDLTTLEVHAVDDKVVIGQVGNDAADPVDESRPATAPAAAATPAAGTAPAAARPATDAFAPWALLYDLTRAASTGETLRYGVAGGWSIELEPAASFQAHRDATQPSPVATEEATSTSPAAGPEASAPEAEEPDGLAGTPVGLGVGPFRVRLRAGG